MNRRPKDKNSSFMFPGSWGRDVTDQGGKGRASGGIKFIKDCGGAEKAFTEVKVR